MVCDVGNFRGRETEVKRVENSATDRDPEVGFEMRVVVPHESCYAVTALQACFLKSLGKSTSAPVKIGVGVAMQFMIGTTRDDLDVREIFACTLQNVRERQRVMHHGSVHGDEGGSGEPAVLRKQN